MVIMINDQVSSNYLIVNGIVAEGIKTYSPIFYEFLSFFKSIFKKYRFSIWKKGFSFKHNTSEMNFCAFEGKIKGALF